MKEKVLDAVSPAAMVGRADAAATEKVSCPRLHTMTASPRKALSRFLG